MMAKTMFGNSKRRGGSAKSNFKAIEETDEARLRLTLAALFAPASPLDDAGEPWS